MNFFDFGEALRLMRDERQRVKRAHWDTQRIYLLGDKIRLRFDDDPEGVEYTPVTTDILACDWRVALYPGEGVAQRLPLGWE